MKDKVPELCPGAQCFPAVKSDAGEGCRGESRGAHPRCTVLQLRNVIQVIKEEWICTKCETLDLTS